MTRTKLLIVFTSLGLVSYAGTTKDTCKSRYDEELKREIFTFVDNMPKYPGGEQELFKLFNKNFVYPKGQEEFQASIYISFVIEPDGSTTNINASSRMSHVEEPTLADKEAIRVFNLMKKWEAGQCDGKNVAVKLYFPIKF